MDQDAIYAETQQMIEGIQQVLTGRPLMQGSVALLTVLADSLSQHPEAERMLSIALDSLTSGTQRLLQDRKKQKGNTDVQAGDGGADAPSAGVGEAGGAVVSE